MNNAIDPRDVPRTLRPRGACPRLSEPMETGDGLLARIVPSGLIPIDGFAALCAAARTHGNGLMEVTARGSLQIRGLSDISAPRFADAVEALGIPFDDRVPVIASPLPARSAARFDPRGLAAGSRRRRAGSRRRRRHVHDARGL